MKIGTKGHYAVTAMMELAKKTDLKKPIPLNTLSVDQVISVHYLELLFVKLKKAGLVKSIRGSQGGYLLTRPASQISIFDIIMAVGEKVRVTRCDHESASSCFRQKDRCALHGLWDGLSHQIYGYLSQISLGALVETELSQTHILLKIPEKITTYKTNFF